MSKYNLKRLDKSRSRRYFDCLYRRINGLFRSNRRRLSENGNTAVHNSSNKKQYKICFIQRYKGVNGRLKKVYGAADEETAIFELEQFSSKWDVKYPKISQSWQARWAELSTYFKYPQSVRTLIYTTNSIENFNRQLRKVTKSKAVFPNDDALLKMLYLAQVDITKKWTGRRRDWGEIHSQLVVFFADRLSEWQKSRFISRVK